MAVRNTLEMSCNNYNEHFRALRQIEFVERAKFTLSDATYVPVNSIHQFGVRRCKIAKTLLWIKWGELVVP